MCLKLKNLKFLLLLSSIFFFTACKSDRSSRRSSKIPPKKDKEKVILISAKKSEAENKKLEKKLQNEVSKRGEKIDITVVKNGGEMAEEISKNPFTPATIIPIHLDEPKSKADEKMICCESYGLGSRGVKVNQKYTKIQASFCKVPEGFVGGNKQRVSESFCQKGSPASGSADASERKDEAFSPAGAEPSLPEADESSDQTAITIGVIVGVLAIGGGAYAYRKKGGRKKSSPPAGPPSAEGGGGRGGTAAKATKQRKAAAAKAAETAKAAQAQANTNKIKEEISKLSPKLKRITKELGYDFSDDEITRVIESNSKMDRTDDQYQQLLIDHLLKSRDDKVKLQLNQRIQEAKSALTSSGNDDQARAKLTVKELELEKAILDSKDKFYHAKEVDVAKAREEVAEAAKDLAEKEQAEAPKKIEKLEEIEENKLTEAQIAKKKEYLQELQGRKLALEAKKRDLEQAKEAVKEAEKRKGIEEEVKGALMAKGLSEEEVKVFLSINKIESGQDKDKYISQLDPNWFDQEGKLTPQVKTSLQTLKDSELQGAKVKPIAKGQAVKLDPDPQHYVLPEKFAKSPTFLSYGEKMISSNQAAVNKSAAYGDFTPEGISGASNSCFVRAPMRLILLHAGKKGKSEIVSLKSKVDAFLQKLPQPEPQYLKDIKAKKHAKEMSELLDSLANIPAGEHDKLLKTQKADAVITSYARLVSHYHGLEDGVRDYQKKHTGADKSKITYKNIDDFRKEEHKKVFENFGDQFPFETLPLADSPGASKSGAQTAGNSLMDHFGYHVDTYTFDNVKGVEGEWNKGSMGNKGQKIDGILVGGAAHWDVLKKK